MATYKYRTFLAENQADIFDDAYQQDSMVVHSGIYRCFECAAEIAVAKNQRLPPCSYHAPSIEGHTLWRLLVRAS